MTSQAGSSKPTGISAASRQARGKDRASNQRSASQSESRAGTLVQTNVGNAGTSLGRKPRKLRTWNEWSEAGSVRGDSGSVNGGIGSEVQALKSKVLQIEEQIKEILQRPPGPKSAKRRKSGKKRSDNTKGEKVTAKGTGVEGEDERQIDLEALQQEINSTRVELANLRLRDSESQQQVMTIAPGRAGQTHHGPHEDIEEITRLHGPGLEVRPRPLDRAVTLSGSYSIPLPPNIREQDLEAIQRGINSAQNLARSFIDERKLAQASFRNEINPPHSTAPLSSSPPSWTSWLGTSSLSIARAASKIQISSTFEKLHIQSTFESPPLQSRPRLVNISGRSSSTPGRSNSTPSETRTRRPRKLEIRSGSGGVKKPAGGTGGTGRTVSETRAGR